MLTLRGDFLPAEALRLSRNARRHRHATREQILAVLAFCQRGDRPEANVRFLGYAFRRGWLEES